MIASRLDNAVERFATKLTELETATPPSAEQVLDVLMARDAVHAALADKTQSPKKSLITISELDSRLRKKAESISQVVNLADWRAILNPPAESWWWFFEAPTPQWDRFDWLWSALSVSFLTVSLGLLTDISTRFLSGGPDTLGATAVIAQSILTLLAGGGSLTKTGQEGIQRLLTRLNIPKHFWHEVSCGFAGLLMLSLLGFRLSLPQIAEAYNKRGFENHQAGQLSSAQNNYERAIKLDPDYLEAHYNLGSLYEDLQEFDRARSEYKIAAQGGLDAAYNNLARLYILDKKYSEAVSLLLKGLKLAEDDKTKYDMLKNLGWARLGQTRYAEAKGYLQDAIDLASERAPAHCLLAQVLEGQGAPKSSLVEWENCRKYASSFNPDEDAWIHLARQRLEKAKGNK